MRRDSCAASSVDARFAAGDLKTQDSSQPKLFRVPVANVAQERPSGSNISSDSANNAVWKKQ
jgi:hypothetical protein